MAKAKSCSSSVLMAGKVASFNSISRERPSRAAHSGGEDLLEEVRKALLLLRCLLGKTRSLCGHSHQLQPFTPVVMRSCTRLIRPPPEELRTSTTDVADSRTASAPSNAERQQRRMGLHADRQWLFKSAVPGVGSIPDPRRQGRSFYVLFGSASIEGSGQTSFSPRSRNFRFW
jgi:hypothetical protein